MKKLLIILVCIFGLLAVSTNVFAQNGEDVAAIDDAQLENMDFDDMLSTASGYLANFDEVISNGYAMLDEARSKEDVVLMDCINERLVAVRGFYNVAKSSETNLKAAAASKDRSAASHHMKLLNLSAMRCQSLASEIQSCVGKDVDYIGNTILEAERNCEVEPCLEGEKYTAPEIAPVAETVSADQAGVLDPVVSSFQ